MKKNIFFDPASKDGEKKKKKRLNDIKWKIITFN